MDTEHFEQLLLEKQRELQEEIGRLESEAREPAEEVEDPIDEVTSAEAKAGALGASSIEREMLKNVQDALQRIKNGTYGVCIDGGEQIEPARLEAIPWTPYCMADQEKHDREKEAEGESSGTLDDSTAV